MKATHSEELSYFWLLASNYHAAKRDGDTPEQKQFVRELCDLYLLADNPEITQVCGTLLLSEGYTDTLTAALNRHSIQTVVSETGNDNDTPSVRQIEETPCGY